MSLEGEKTVVKIKCSCGGIMTNFPDYFEELDLNIFCKGCFKLPEYVEGMTRKRMTERKPFTIKPTVSERI
jgi:hypothetical protein